jgi:hypothetical protein
MGAHEQRTKAKAEITKLNLEIGILKRQHLWVENLVKFVPVIATTIAVLGLGFTIWQALNAQRDERTSKIQSQILTDKEQILEFVTNDKTSSIRVAFLLDDLNSLIRQLSDREAETKVVTEQLMRVAWELPLAQRRDFDFDVSALRRWTNFRQFWQSYPFSHHLFLAQKYYPRLVQLHAKEAACIEKLDYAAGTNILSYPIVDTPCQEELINALMNGFEEHLKLIKETNRFDLVRVELEEFKKSTNNFAFAERL